MLQKIAAVCTVVSFFTGIYITLIDNPEWQRYSLFGFAFLLCVLLLINKKSKFRIFGKAITLRRAQPLPYPYRMVEVMVFYPKPFKYTPNLNIHFQKIKYYPYSYELGSKPTEPEYKITEQSSDGFKIEILSFAKCAYKPIIKWQAKGIIKE